MTTERVWIRHDNKQLYLKRLWVFCLILGAIIRCACRIFDEQMLLVIIIWLEPNHLKECNRILCHFLSSFLLSLSLSLCSFRFRVFIVLLCYSRTIFGIFLEHKCHYKFEEALWFGLFSIAFISHSITQQPPRIVIVASLLYKFNRKTRKTTRRNEKTHRSS